MLWGIILKSLVSCISPYLLVQLQHILGAFVHKKKKQNYKDLHHTLAIIK